MRPADGKLVAAVHGRCDCRRDGGYAAQDRSLAHDVTFAFVFHGFRPDDGIFVECADGKEIAKSLVCR